MKKIIITTATMFIALLSNAQTQKLIDISSFKKIEVSGTAIINYRQSDTLSLKIEANDDEINNVFAKVENETLIIKLTNDFKSTYNIYVSNNKLTDILCSGASKITSTNAIIADSLSINVSGASTLNLKSNANAINVLQSGASTIILEGTAKTLYTTVSGASTLKAYKLNATTGIIKVSGASIAKVMVNERILANATGASTIKFKGNPKDVSAEASTSSIIANVIDGEKSQQDKNGKDSTSINFGKRKIIIINKDRDAIDEVTKRVDNDEFHHWGGFAMGVNGLLFNGSTTLPKPQNYMNLNYGKSLNFQLNFEKDIHLYKNYINLVSGIGFEWSHYQFANKTTLNPDSSFTFGKIDTSGIYNYKKNKLKTTFINVPLLFEFNTNKNADKAFHIALGVIGGYKLGSRTRQILELNSNDIKIVRKDDYNINAFRVSAHASVGYKKITVFGTYALTNLFESGKGIALTPFTVGIKIVSF